MMGGTCFTSFYSSFIQDLHSTGSPGVPLLKAEYTKKRRRRILEERYCCGGRGCPIHHLRRLRQQRKRFGGSRHSLRGQQIDGHCQRIEIVRVILKLEIMLAKIVMYLFF